MLKFEAHMFYVGMSSASVQDLFYFFFLTELQNKLKILREVNDFKEGGTEA